MIKLHVEYCIIVNNIADRLFEAHVDSWPKWHSVVCDNSTRELSPSNR